MFLCLSRIKTQLFQDGCKHLNLQSRLMAKKNLKGPLNSVLDPTELGSASMEPSHAVKESGSYDVWAAPDEQD